MVDFFKTVIIKMIQQNPRKLVFSPSSDLMLALSFHSLVSSD